MDKSKIEYLEFYKSELGKGKHCTKSFGLVVWQHQQAKVEEANAKAQMCRDEKNHAINRWSAVCKERDELQKRVEWLEDRLKASDTLSKMRAAVIGSFNTKEFNARTRRKFLLLKKAEQEFKVGKN